MLIRFTRLTDDRHRFEIVREDGTSEAHELETRSTLLHDLTHYAVEAEAGLEGSFYGRLSRGMTYAALSEPASGSVEAFQTEAVVARMQGGFRDGRVPKTDPAQCAEEIGAGFRSIGAEPPIWLTPDLIARARERLRRVHGQWRATPFHDTMELEFPLQRDSGVARAAP